MLTLLDRQQPQRVEMLGLSFVCLAQETPLVPSVSLGSRCTESNTCLIGRGGVMV